MKTNYRFEIVRVTHRRYSWRFVVIEEGRRRVLDRSDRDWRSPRRVRRAIARMQGAPVVDLSRMTDRDLFPLPVGTFRIVNGVLPLMVETSSVEFEPSSRRSDVVQPADTKAVVVKKDDKQLAAKAPDKLAGKTQAATMTSATTTTTRPAGATPEAAKAPQAHAAGPATGSAAAKSHRGRKAT